MRPGKLNKHGRERAAMLREYRSSIDRWLALVLGCAANGQNITTLELGQFL